MTDLSSACRPSTRRTGSRETARRMQLPPAKRSGPENAHAFVHELLGFGMGLSATRLGTPERRDRLLFISAVAPALLTLLGAAGEACGLGRTPEGEYGEAPDEVALQPRLLLVPAHSQHERRATPASHDQLRRAARPSAGVPPALRNSLTAESCTTWILHAYSRGCVSSGGRSTISRERRR